MAIHRHPKKSTTTPPPIPDEPRALPPAKITRVNGKVVTSDEDVLTLTGKLIDGATTTGVEDPDDDGLSSVGLATDDRPPWDDFDGDRYADGTKRTGAGYGKGSQSYGKHSGYGSGGGGGKSTIIQPRCHTKHKEIAIGGGTLLGASCCDPREGFDVYVGFDSGMKLVQATPWGVNPNAPVQAKALITDGSVPKDKADFDAMIDYLIEELAEGKRVHIGCIGGHGRTGLVMAVLVNVINGEQDAITWVREHHCEKGVESIEQVKWLNKHYGIKEVKGSKAWTQTEFKGKYTPSAGKGGMGLTGGGGGGRAVTKAELDSKQGDVFGRSGMQSDIRDGDTLTPIPGSTRVF